MNATQDLNRCLPLNWEFQMNCFDLSERRINTYHVEIAKQDYQNLLNSYQALLPRYDILTKGTYKIEMDVEQADLSRLLAQCDFLHLPVVTHSEIKMDQQHFSLTFTHNFLSREECKKIGSSMNRMKDFNRDEMSWYRNVDQQLLRQLYKILLHFPKNKMIDLSVFSSFEEQYRLVYEHYVEDLYNGTRESSREELALMAEMLDQVRTLYKSFFDLFQKKELISSVPYQDWVQDIRVLKQYATNSDLGERTFAIAFNNESCLKRNVGSYQKIKR